MRKTGCVHVYCGGGKGKTTAALGLAIRAAGCGLPVLIYQFMKANDSSERKILAQIDHITCIEGKSQEKFSFQMNEREKEERKKYYLEKFHLAVKMTKEQGIKLLILDEILYAIRADLFEEEALIRFLKNKPEDLEVVLTGQDPSPEIKKEADYVTSMEKIKHPFDEGVAARRGIEC